MKTIVAVICLCFILSGWVYSATSGRSQFISPAIYIYGIDTTVSGATPLVIGYQEGNFLPVEVVIRSKNISGVISLPSLSIGTNPINYNNILPTTALVNFTDNNQISVFQVSGRSGLVESGDDVYINVITPAVAGTSDFDAFLVGWHL